MKFKNLLYINNFYILISILLYYTIIIIIIIIFQSLIKEGACVDEFDIRGYTPLYLAVTNDENEYIKLLALATTNFNVADTNGNGLLHQVNVK